MRDEVLNILEKHYHGRNFIEDSCADDLIELINNVSEQSFEEGWKEAHDQM